MRFSVIDTGHGVPKEIAANLYKPFMPGDTSYARRAAGRGPRPCGRQTHRRNAGGETGFESEPGEGSTFWFTIPVAGAAATSAVVARCAGNLGRAEQICRS